MARAPYLAGRESGRYLSASAVSGRILGLPGRILISAMGVIVAMLSITGIVIWARKLRARTVASPKQLARVQRRTANQI